MKKFILSVLMLGVLTVQAQTQPKVIDLDKKVNKTEAKPTGDVAIYHGEKKPVYISAKGKQYIIVTSQKSGKEYKKYLN